MIDSNLKKWELHTRESCTSALDVAREFIEKTELLPEGNAFLVSEQTKGRGRMDRVWISHKNDGMYLSVIYLQNALTPNGQLYHLLPLLLHCKQ